MLKAWVKRWLGLNGQPEPLGDPQPSLELRVFELEQHVDFLDGALRKLRGRVTGAIRHNNPAPDGAESGPVSDAPASEPLPRQWDLARLAAGGKPQ